MSVTTLGTGVDPVERIAAAGHPPILLSCEHASNRAPPGWEWPHADAHLREQHWAYDIGVAEITRRLAARVGAAAVLSRFSRLLIDPNRPLDSETLFRDTADGRPVVWNVGLTEPERERRIRLLYEPYHQAFDEMVAAHPGVHVLSLHSFTPLYEGQPRTVEVGVLYDRDEDYAEPWMQALSATGWDVRRNEPWSGKAGLMYSPQRHAAAHGRRAIELELRQDHTVDLRRSDEIVDVLAAAVLQISAMSW